MAPKKEIKSENGAHVTDNGGAGSRATMKEENVALCCSRTTENLHVRTACKFYSLQAVRTSVYGDAIDVNSVCVCVWYARGRAGGA